MLPIDVWRIDLALCAGEFRRGRLSEAGFRHHLARLGYLAHEIEAEVEHHRASEMKAVPIGPVLPRNGETGPQRGSDASQYQRSDRSRAPLDDMIKERST
jgi:hypothetical protein